MDPIFRAEGHRLGEANTLQCIGELALQITELAEARDAYDRALVIFREEGDSLGEAAALRGIGDVALKSADLVRAKQAHEEALGICRSIGDRLGEAFTLQSIGDLALMSANVAGAKHAYDAALALDRALGERLGEANALQRSGAIAVRYNDPTAAKQLYDKALTLYRAIIERLGESETLRALGVLALLQGQGVTEPLLASRDLARTIHDPRGTLISEALLAIADPTPAAPAALDTLADRFSSLALPWETLLTRAAARLRANDVPAAATLLRERPETVILAQALAHATPEEGSRLLLPIFPTF